jgi:hypothetical protein
MCLSQISRVFRVACEPTIFETITLSDHDKRSCRTTKHILKRLGDPADNLLKHVRQICVGYTSKTASLPETAIMIALRNVHILRVLIWRTWLQPSDRALECFHDTHPFALLKVIALERNDMPLDEALLASPQLHLLDIKLSELYDNNDYWRLPCKGKSELRYLKPLLLRSTSLKVLRIGVEHAEHGSKTARNRLQCYGPSEWDPSTFRLEEGKVMPALEELVIPDLFPRVKSQLPVTDACRAWKVQIDWSAMRTLDLRQIDAAGILFSIAGSVPHLETLKISSVSDASLHLFLQSARHLAYLHVECHISYCTRILQCICGTVGPQLLSLYIKVGHVLSDWDQSNCQDVISRCPRLQALGMEDDNGQVFGVWTPLEAKLPTELKSMRLIGTIRECVSSRRFATRHSHCSWYEAGAYIKYPGRDRQWTYFIPQHLAHSGRNDDDIQRWERGERSDIVQLMERFGLVAAALRNDRHKPFYNNVWH